MNDRSMDQQLVDANTELRRLQETIKEKENAIADMEMDMNFHVVKNAELSDILASRAQDDMTEQLQAQSHKNAELTVQVQDLRYHLNSSAESIQKLESQCEMSNMRVEKLLEDRREHQRIIAAVRQLAKEAASIHVPHTGKAGKNQTVKDSDDFVAKLKDRIIHIEADRQRCMVEHQIMQTKLFETGLEVDTLHDELRQKQAVERDCERLAQGNLALRKVIEEKDEEIARLQEGEEVEPAMEVLLQDDGSTVVFDAATPVHENRDDEASYLSLAESLAESHEQDAAEGLAQWQDRYAELETQHELTKGQIHTMEEHMKAAIFEVEEGKKKQRLREQLLQDVIDQYKALQRDHEAATSRITDLEDQMHRDPMGKYPHKQASTDLAAQTFDSGDGTIATHPTTSTATDHDSAGSLSPTATRSTAGQVQIEFDKERSLLEECQRLEKECTRLESDYELAMTRVTSLEADLKTAAETAQDEKRILQVDHAATLHEVQEELRTAQLAAQQARDKQQEREHDLREVIAQYKELTQENKEARLRLRSIQNRLEETEEEMAQVQQELLLTQKEANRRDLVHEYRQMEQHYRKAQQDVEELEQALQRSKSDAAKSKEDVKCTRQRLAMYHVDFQSLQRLHDTTVQEKLDMERGLARAEEQVEQYRAQQAKWSDKLSWVRQRQSETKSEKEASTENGDLKAYCQNLLEQTAESCVEPV